MTVEFMERRVWNKGDGLRSEMRQALTEDLGDEAFKV